MSFVDRVELDNLVQGSGGDQLLQLPLVAVCGLPVVGLEDDLHLVIVLDGGARGEHARDPQLGGAVLDSRGVYLGRGRLGQAAAPPEHLVLGRIVNLDDLGANLKIEKMGNKFLFNLM